MTATLLHYEDIVKQASRLSPQEKATLIAELENQMRAETDTGGKRSIGELRGLGKEIWEGIDAQEYVNAERDSWERDPWNG